MYQKHIVNSHFNLDHDNERKLSEEKLCKKMRKSESIKLKRETHLILHISPLKKTYFLSIPSNSQNSRLNNFIITLVGRKISSGKEFLSFHRSKLRKFEK